MQASSFSAGRCCHSTCRLPHSQYVGLQRTHSQSRCPVRRRLQIAALWGNKEGGGGNPFAGMGDLMANVKRAQELVKVEGAKVQEELAAAEFEGFSADETVRVVVSGNQLPVTVDITEEALAQGAEKLSDMVTEAMKEAHARSVDAMKERMAGLASSLGLGANGLGQ